MRFGFGLGAGRKSRSPANLLHNPRLLGAQSEAGGTTYSVPPDGLTLLQPSGDSQLTVTDEGGYNSFRIVCTAASRRQFRFPSVLLKKGKTYLYSAELDAAKSFNVHEVLFPVNITGVAYTIQNDGVNVGFGLQAPGRSVVSILLTVGAADVNIEPRIGLGINNAVSNQDFTIWQPKLELGSQRTTF